MAFNIPPPPQTDDMESPAWRIWFFRLVQSLQDAQSLGNVSGILAPSQGGTGVANQGTEGKILVGNGVGYVEKGLLAGNGISIDASSEALTISATASGEGGIPQCIFVTDSNGNVIIDSEGNLVTLNSGESEVFVTTSNGTIVTDNAGNPVTTLSSNGGGACLVGDQVINVDAPDFTLMVNNGKLIPSAVYHSTTGDSYIAISTSEYETLSSSGATGTGSVTVQNHVINLVADTPTTIPHTFSTSVSNYRAYDSLGNEIDLAFTYNVGSKILTACSTAPINNILIIVEGEL